MIAGAASGAGEAPGDAGHEGVLVNGQLYDMVEFAPAFSEEDLERLSLVLGAGKPVEDRAAVRSSVEPLADESADDGVADQLPALHHFLGLEAYRRPGSHRLAEHVARRQLDHAALCLKPRGLSALARAGRAQEDDVQHSGAFSLFAD